MMRRTAVAALCGAALIATPAVALAMDGGATGPGTTACSDARLDVDTVVAANTAESAETKAEAALQVRVDAGGDLLDKPVNETVDEVLDDLLTGDPNADIDVAVQSVLVARADAVAARDEEDKLALVGADLNALISIRDRACAVPDGDGGTDPADLNPCEINADPPSAAFIAGLETMTPAAAQAQVNQLGDNGIILLDSDPATPTVDIDPNIESFIVIAVDRFITENCDINDGQDGSVDDIDGASDGGDFDQVGQAPVGSVATGG